jgi:hypothetical protein
MAFWSVVLSVSNAPGQFMDDFSASVIARDPRAARGWAFYTGDGSAVVDFARSAEGIASVTVDATKDRRNIWWALIRRRVSDSMDLRTLKTPGYALRIEARIRISHAPRRVNLHLNTQRTTDFHSHLMEFDIADTSDWHTISMTTPAFDAVPGDSVYGQLALMDWGVGRYRVDLDYFRVDIVKVDSAGPDRGTQVPYHPLPGEPGSFTQHIVVRHDGMIDSEYPDVRFNEWSCVEDTDRSVLLTVHGSQDVILRWDLRSMNGQTAAGSGLLELTTFSLQRIPPLTKDFGMVRITEIIGGDPAWDQEGVTYNSLCRGQPLQRVLNEQMIIDVPVAERRGRATLATISRPVLQRLIDGTTRGLAVRPLGAVNASFYALENNGGAFGAKLHFSVARAGPHPAPTVR